MDFIPLGKSAGLLITLIPWSWFGEWKDGRVKHRGEHYENLKEQLAAQMWRQTEELFPQLAGKVGLVCYWFNILNRSYKWPPYIFWDCSESKNALTQFQFYKNPRLCQDSANYVISK